MRSKVKGSGRMLQESILRLYRRLRLDGYRKLFGAVQERGEASAPSRRFRRTSLTCSENRRSASLPSMSAFPSRTRPTRSTRWQARAMWRRSSRSRTGVKSGSGPERSLHSILTRTARQSAPRQSGCARSFPKAKSTRRAACLTQCWMQCRRAGKEPMYD